MTEQATIDTSEPATVENMRTLTFEAMSDVKIPGHEAWMEYAAKHRLVLGIGWAPYATQAPSWPKSCETMKPTVIGVTCTIL